MKVFIDSNILISAAMNPNGTPAKAYMKAVTHPNRGMICEQNMVELRRFFNKKHPELIPALEHFWATAIPALELVETPDNADVGENCIRDATDRPILRSAIHAHADILITGDKDFLESTVKHPAIMTAWSFLHMEDA